MKDRKSYNIWNKSYGKTIFKSITSVPIDYFHFGGKEFIRRKRLRERETFINFHFWRRRMLQRRW